MEVLHPHVDATVTPAVVVIGFLDLGRAHYSAFRSQCTKDIALQSRSLPGYYIGALKIRIGFGGYIIL